jgi:hypothetical protein
MMEAVRISETSACYMDIKQRYMPEVLSSSGAYFKAEARVNNI